MTDQRNRFKHAALDQWYRVGQSADENSAFLDGFGAGWQARESEVEELRRTIRELVAMLRSVLCRDPKCNDAGHRRVQEFLERASSEAGYKK